MTTNAHVFDDNGYCEIHGTYCALYETVTTDARFRVVRSQGWWGIADREFVNEAVALAINRELAEYIRDALNARAVIQKAQDAMTAGWCANCGPAMHCPMCTQPRPEPPS